MQKIVRNVAELGAWTYLGHRAKQARAKQRPVKKNPGGVFWLAAGMLAYGALKSGVFTKHTLRRCGCPSCVGKIASQAVGAGSLLTSVVTGPVREEIMFRHTLGPLIGSDYASALFGVAHASSKLSAGGNVLRMLEAGLSGALAYSAAYKQGGVVGASLVHAAHNAGTSLGAILALTLDGPRARAGGARP